MIAHRLNSELTVYRATYVDDGAGGRTRTFGEVGVIRAQVSQPSAQERMAAGQEGALLMYVVHTTADADVEREDELDTGAGRRYRVKAVLQDSRRTYKRLECEVTQGE